MKHFAWNDLRDIVTVQGRTWEHEDNLYFNWSSSGFTVRFRGSALLAEFSAQSSEESAAGRHQQTGGSIPARSCRYGILGAHLLPPAGHGETAGRKADARSAEQPKSVLCCIYEK